MSTKMAVSQPWHFVSRGKLPKIRVNTSGKETYLHTWSEQPCLQSGTTHRWAPGESPHLASGVPRHLSKDPEGWSAPLSRYNWGRLQTTAGKPSSTHQCAASCHVDLPWHRPPESLPCWIEDFACPAGHLAPEILPYKMLTTPLPTVLPPWPTDWDSGTRVHYPPLIAVCMCCISLRLLEYEEDINVCWCSTSSEPAFNKNWVNSIVTVCDSCLFLGARLLSRQLSKQLPGWLIGKTISRTYTWDSS